MTSSNKFRVRNVREPAQSAAQENRAANPNIMRNADQNPSYTNGLLM
jgi:hypothetical protein